MIRLALIALALALFAGDASECGGRAARRPLRNLFARLRPAPAVASVQTATRLTLPLGSVRVSPCGPLGCPAVPMKK